MLRKFKLIKWGPTEMSIFIEISWNFHLCQITVLLKALTEQNEEECSGEKYFTVHHCNERSKTASRKTKTKTKNLHQSKMTFSF